MGAVDFGGGGFDLSNLGGGYQPSANPEKSSGGGWFGSWHDPLGIVSGIKNIGQGLATSFGGILANTGIAAADFVTGQGSEGLEHLGAAGQGVGDIPVGIGLGLEGLGATAATMVGMGDPYKDIMAKFNHWAANNAGQQLASPMLREEMDNNGQGYRPRSFTDIASGEGLASAALQTAANLAIVAGPVAGVAGAMAGTAEEAAAGATAAGALEEAASYAAKAGRLKSVAENLGHESAVGKAGSFAFNPFTGESSIPSFIRDIAGRAADRTVAAGGEAPALGRVANVANQLAHPFEFAGIHTADLLKAMYEKGYPAEAKVAEPEVVATETQPDVVAPEELVAARANMNPREAAAEALTAADQHPDGALAELHRLSNVIAGAAETSEPFIEAPPAPGTVRLYNGGENDQTMWTEDRGRAEKYGTLRHVDVPEEEAAQMRSSGAHLEAREGGSQPTEGDHYMAPSQYETYREGVVDHPAPESKLGKPVEPRDEPGRYKTPRTAEEPRVAPGEAAAADETLRAETAAARDQMRDLPLYVMDRTGVRLNSPTPQWAKAVADMLPDSINRLLGHAGNGFIDQVRLRNVARNVMQLQETTQAYARRSPAMIEGKDAATLLLSRTIGRPAALDAVGQELHARLNGEAVVAEWAKNHLGLIPSDEVRARLEGAARGDYAGITDEMWSKLSEQDRAKMQEHLNAAEAGFRAQSKDTLTTLLASRFGARSLEAAILNPSEVLMSPEQLRMYRGIERDLRAKAKFEERIPDERARAQADAAKADAMGEKRHDYVDQLRKEQGTNEATIEDARRGVPKGMEREGEATIGKVLGELAETGGAYADVAAGNMLRPEEGIFTPISQQGAGVRLDAGEAAIRDYLHEAMFFPKSGGGNNYDPVSLYDGMDARLSVNVVSDADGAQRIVATIGMSTIGGRAIQPWQARILGDAHEQSAGYDFRSGDTVPFSNSPLEQNAAKHYVGDLFNPNSRLSKWATQRSAAIEKLSINPNQLNDVQAMLLALDKVFEERNPNWHQGDIFETETTAEKNLTKLAHLAQTIMPVLDHDGLANTGAHFIRALDTADVAGVNKMLQWYYTSHDFVETTWRGKQAPMGRDAAEVFYDLLAVSSVMASPTQNLGRALAGLDNLDQFISSRKGDFQNTVQLMNEIMGNKPAGYIYVKDVGLPTEKTSPTRRQGYSAISKRWFDSPAARELTEQTSMVTSAKYRIIDVLMGKLDLSTATADQLNQGAEWWTGKVYKSSDKALTPDAVLHHAKLLDLRNPEVQAYRDWTTAHAQLVEARDVRHDPNHVPPLTDREDTQRKRAERSAEGVPILGGREVSPSEYQDMANDGRLTIAQARASGSPHALTGDTLAQLKERLWTAVQKPWGGETVDAHTGEDHVPAPGEKVVTTRLPKAKGQTAMKETAVPLTKLDRAAFDKAIDSALKEYKPVLDMEGGHLGVFHNEDSGAIEIDPVYVADGEYMTDSIGAYTHANGGAYDYDTELDANGVRHKGEGSAHWIPHVRDEAYPSTWTNKQVANADVAKSRLAGRDIARSPGLRPAYENALMEYHGSGLIAKLRSFRSNLADPHNSLAVTLDSIMAQLWGYDQTFWGGKNNYATYADFIRHVADEWSTIKGEKIMPHEVQAVLWVYAKKAIGEADFARILAHQTNALKGIDFMEEAVRNGGKLNLKGYDPMTNYWREELQFSRDQLAVRSERKALSALRTDAEEGGKPLTKKQQARLDYLEQVPTRQTTKVQAQRGGEVAWEDRDETSYDANKLRGREDQVVKYYNSTLGPLKKALAEGRFDDARGLVTDYVTSRQKSMLNGIDGEAFSKEMIEKGLKDPNSVTAERLARLQYAEHVPHPNIERITTGELAEQFKGTTRGVTLENPSELGRILMKLYRTADMTTLLHENLHAIRLMAPGDEVAQLSVEYPHIQDATLTPERVADEERFVSDFMQYLHARARAGDARLSPAMRSQVRYSGPLRTLFNNVADVLDENQQRYLQTPGGKAIMPAITNYWDSIFNTHIEAPDVAHDPLVQQYSPENKGVNPKQLRTETDFAYTQRVRQYGEARGRAKELPRVIAAAQKRAAEADKFANTMHGLVLEPTKSELRAAQYGRLAEKRGAKLAQQLAEPSGNAVPRIWRPYMEAIERIREEIKDDPSLAPLANEIPENFGRALQLAAAEGFEPSYTPELTWENAQKYLFGHLSLSTREAEAGLRKENKGVLNKHQMSNRSLASLGAGTVMAMKELLTSRLVQFVEEHYARQWAPGQAIPEGWRAWDSTRDAIITGRNIEGEIVSANANKIVPDAVHKTLRSLQAQPVDLPFRNLWKGGPVAVWKHLLLTYSPTWYIKHFVGAFATSLVEGVRLQDYRVAWKQARSGEVPYAASMKNIYAAIDDVTGNTTGTLIERRMRTPGDVKDIWQSEGRKAVAQKVNNSLRRIVTNVDQFNRAAVYARSMRVSEGNVGYATSRAFEAIGDFGRLSPLERSVVTSLIPFYAFQKSMFRLLMRMPADHPMVTALVMQLGSMHQAYLKDKLGTEELPEAYAGADFIGGKLMPLDKLNPLSDSYKLITPQGIAQSMHPYLKPLVQQALGQQAFDSLPGMDATGNLISQPDMQNYMTQMFTSNPVAQLGAPNINTASALSEKQYASLVKRLLRTNKAMATIDAGGFMVTDAIPPKKPF